MEKTQHFTNDELILLHEAIMEAQKRLGEAIAVLSGIAVDTTEQANKVFAQLRELNSKVCGYMDEE